MHAFRRKKRSLFTEIYSLRVRAPPPATHTHTHTHARTQSRTATGILTICQFNFLEKVDGNRSQTGSSNHHISCVSASEYLTRCLQRNENNDSSSVAGSAPGLATVARVRLLSTSVHRFLYPLASPPSEATWTAWPTSAF